MSKQQLIHAAGAVVLRPGPSGSKTGTAQEVLVVHRPAYDDWSLPKGKQEAHESLPVCAVREVAEETGVQIRLDFPLDSVSYPVSKGTKVVRWWRAYAIGESPRNADDEVDEVCWLQIEDALDRLSYADDRDLVRQALRQPETTTFVLTRHAKAMNRKDWSGKDHARPLTRHGRAQSAALVEVLRAYGVARVLSSDAQRCDQTVRPYAGAVSATLEAVALLCEEIGGEAPDQVTEWVAGLRAEVVHEQVPAVVCGHRPVLPAMLAALDVPERAFHTAESLVLCLTADNEVAAVDWVRVSPRR